MYRFVRFKQKPQAMAEIKGSAIYPAIHGTTFFYQTEKGVLVATEVWGLPAESLVCARPVFGLHIHNGSSCTGNETDSFADAGAHWNPEECPHPYHAGDLPSLFGNDGYAFSAMLTNRFQLDSVIGKTVIIHSDPDDFTTQPAGNSGIRIACGEITKGK